MTSLKDLAKAVGLSITQVSRALDDKPDVSAATKIKVRAAAKQYGYQPNAAARSLRKQKADMVAVVLPAGANHIGLASLVNMLYDTADHLGHYGFDLVMVPGREQADELTTIRRIVEGRRADAIIIVRTRLKDDRVAFLHERGIPFVTHGRTDGTIEHAWIDGDGESGFAEATRILAKLGHKSIAHIAAPADMMFAHVRRMGWLRGLEEAGLDKAPIEISAAPNEAAGKVAAQELLKSRIRPTALLCATDAMAIGAISAVRDAGLKPGIDISIIGHDDLYAGLLTTPQLSSMQIDANDIGRRLADKINKRLGGADPRDLQELLPVRQVPRASHGPAP